MTVRAADLNSELQGPELGEAVRKARIAAIAAVLEAAKAPSGSPD
jgi:hypothetical protein